MKSLIISGGPSGTVGPSMLALYEYICLKKKIIDCTGISFICVVSTKLPMISLVEAELEYPT